MDTLVCKNCGAEKTVDPTQQVSGKPIIEWWESVNRTCKPCRDDPKRILTVEEFADIFDATEIHEDGTDIAAVARPVNHPCTYCGSDDTEWTLEYVWRHDRTLTEGSRTVDAKRLVRPPEYACQSCINLHRKGRLQSGPGLFN